MSRNLGLIGVSVFFATFVSVLIVAHHLSIAQGPNLHQPWVSYATQTEGQSLALPVIIDSNEPEVWLLNSIENSRGQTIKVSEWTLVESGSKYRAITPSRLAPGLYNVKIRISYQQNWLKHYDKSFVLSVLTVKKKENDDDK